MTSRSVPLFVLFSSLLAGTSTAVAQDVEQPVQGSDAPATEGAPQTPEYVVESGSAAQPPPPAPPPDDGFDVEGRLIDLEERFDRVERNSLLDRVQWGADYRMILNGVHYTGPSPDPYDRASPLDPVTRRIRETNEEIWSHRFRLYVLAQPVDSVRMTARLTMYKIFGNSQGPAFVQDSSSTRVPRDAGLRFDQAWLDWFVTDWLSLSGGRIAYAEGNPAELRDNSTVRKATWGLQMVDGEYDTVNVTFDLHSALEGFRIRGFYASWFNPNTTDVFGGFPFLSSGTDNLRIVGGNIELSIPSIGGNFIQLGYYVAPQFRPFMVPIPDPGFDPAADYTHAPAPLNGSQLFPAAMPESLGSYMNGSALVELYDLGGSGLDLFVAGALGYLQPNGRGIAYDIPADPSDPSSPRLRFPFLFLASEGDDGLTTFLYAGLRYAVPIPALNVPKIGFEFNRGSRFHISFAVQTDQLVTKLSTRGNAYELYLILPVNEHLYFRSSYLFIDAERSAGFFGPNPAYFGSTAPDAPARTHSVQLILNASL